MDSDSLDFDHREVQPAVPSRLLPGIAVSLTFHGLLLVFMINSNVGERSIQKISSVAVRLVDQNPLREEPDPIRIEPTAEPAPIEEPIVPVSEPADLEPDELEIVDSESGESILEELPQGVEQEVADTVAEPPGVTPSQTVDSLPALPSVLAVRNSLREVDRQRQSQFYSYDCDPLEEEAGIRKCEPRSRNNFQLIESNATYRGLNSVKQFSRSQRTSAVVANESAALAGRIREGLIPDGLGDYVMEELEAGITHNSDLGNRAVNHMIDSTDKSAAAALAREILGDNWIIQKSKELQDRQVHVRN